MKVPGIVARHAVITPRCRTVPPSLREGAAARTADSSEVAAFEEAVHRLREEYLACLPANPHSQFHLVLTVERPAPQKEGGES